MIRRLIILLLIVGCDYAPRIDCAGVTDGAAELDNCDVCDTDRTNDCVQDCAGTWGGDAVIDECGVCDGDAVVLWETCYATDITFIELDSRGLTGSIPSEIGNLTNLTGLELNDNQLTGEIPKEIGNLTNLEYLGLWNNQLTGDIPQEVCDLIESNNLDIHNI